LYEEGYKAPFVRTKKIILETETSYKQEYQIKNRSFDDKRKINSLLNDKLTNKPVAQEKVKLFKFSPINSTEGLKLLLMTDIRAKLDDINWDNVDWTDNKTVNVVLEKVVEFVNKQ
jgi:hypothetical protein